MRVGDFGAPLESSCRDKRQMAQTACHADGLHPEPAGPLARRPCEGLWVSRDSANGAEGIAPTWKKGSQASRTRDLT